MHKNIIFLFISLFCCSCIRHTALTDPYSLTATTHSKPWQQKDKSVLKTISPLAEKGQIIFPKEYTQNDRLTLAEIIDLSLINNPLTKQSWADARAAAALYAQSLSSYLPEIKIDASYLRERETYINPLYDVIDNEQKRETYLSTIVEPEITLSYMIYDFGKRKSSTEIAKQALLYADWSHNRELQNIMLAVMTSYYECQHQKELLKALKADLNDAQLGLDAATQKFSAGTASLADTVQAKTLFLQNQMNLIEGRHNMQKAYAELLNNMGLPSNKKIKVLPFTEEPKTDFLISNLDSLIDTAENSRQDFLAAQANLRHSIAQLDYSKSQGRPNLGSNFEIGRNYFDQNLHEDYHFSMAFKLSIPLFKGLYYYNGIKHAEAGLNYAKASLEKLELKMIKEITISRDALTSAAATLACSKDYLLEATKRFEITLANYKAGVNTILDLTTAQTSLADARAKYALAKKDWFSSMANLAWATGALSAPNTTDTPQKINRDNHHEK